MAFPRRFASPADIDAQYNPSIGLADPGEPLRHYQARAGQARATLASQGARLDVPYGPTRAETLDIFPASPDSPLRTAAGAPVFVFLHGGYWRALSSKDFSGVALGLQARGITTVVVDYALCPKVTLDEIVRQARAAVAWVLRHIGEHGGDPGRVAVGGHSAGGHLAAMCLQTDWAGDYGLPADPLRAAVLVSGLYDLEPLRWSYLQPLLQFDADTVQRQSPLLGLPQAPACSARTWVTWGGAETAEFERQAREYAEAAGSRGQPCELSPQPGANHFSAIHGFEDPASPLCDWLVQRLTPTSTGTSA